MPGCAECADDDVHECIECMDKENTDLSNGECACKTSNEVFSQDGYCISCQVLGCSQC